MKVSFTSKGIQQASWHDYAARFLFGGGLTALTGVVAHRYGPSVGGLFLAFPAILPASDGVPAPSARRLRRSGLAATRSQKNVAE